MFEIEIDEGIVIGTIFRFNFMSMFYSSYWLLNQVQLN